MYRSKVFFIILAVILFSCAANFTDFYTFSSHKDNENTTYVKALYDEYNNDSNKAIKSYLSLYKTYNDEYYFNIALILALKNKNYQSLQMINTYPENELSLILNYKNNQNNKIKSYEILKKLAQKYKKEFYFYKILSICNEDKNSFIQNKNLQEICQKDEVFLTDKSPYENKKVLLFDEYFSYNFGALLNELLDYDKFYLNKKNTKKLLSDLKNIKCDDDFNSCFSLLNILAKYEKYDILFEKLNYIKNISKNNFINETKINSIYFQIKNEKLKDKFLKNFFINEKINAYDFKDMIDNKNLAVKMSNKDFWFYYFYFKIVLSKEYAKQKPSFDLDLIKINPKAIPKEILKNFLTLSDDLNINLLIRIFSEPLAKSWSDFNYARSALNNFYANNCKKALKNIQKTQEPFLFNILGQDIDKDMFENILSECANKN